MYLTCQVQRYISQSWLTILTSCVNESAEGIGGWYDPKETAVGRAAWLDCPGRRQPSAGVALAHGRSQAHLLVRNDARARLEGLLSSPRAEPGGCVCIHARGSGRGILARVDEGRNPAPGEGTVELVVTAEIGVLHPNLLHDGVDQALGRLPGTGQGDKLGVVHGRAEGHIDPLEHPRDVASDREYVVHPLDRHRTHSGPRRQNEESRSRAAGSHGAISRPRALRKQRHRAPG